MKKSLIIVLLTALVLCAFTACDGDVNADLSGDGRVVYFKMTSESVSDGWTFADGSTTIKWAVPADCSKWGDLVDKGTIDVKNSGTTTTLTLKSYGDFAWFKNGGTIAEFLEDKAIYTELLETAIVIGATYNFTVDMGT